VDGSFEAAAGADESLSEVRGSWHFDDVPSSFGLLALDKTAIEHSIRPDLRLSANRSETFSANRMTTPASQSTAKRSPFARQDPVQAGDKDGSLT